MLDALRKGAGTWLAKIFIALLIFSFAVWGVSGFLTGVGQNTAAKVGDTEVTLMDLERVYRQDLNRLSQQVGRPVTPDQGIALGIPQQALGKLIAEAALNNTATSLKLGVSDERLAQIIQSDPAFRGLNGRYDRTQLQRVLQANGYREDEYVVERRKVAERGQLAEGLAGGMKAPAAYLQAFDAYQRESRSVDYLLITPDYIGEIEDPAEDVLSNFFQDNLADFRAPEYRLVKYVELTPSALARPGDISEEDARAEYDGRKADYSQPERRKVRQLSFPSAEDANKAAAELDSGKTFDDLMAERNLTNNDVTLGTMARADFLDEAIAEAAFSLDQGASSGAVDGRFSTVIVNVEEILPESTRPFEDVKEEIITDLANEQAEREILDLLDEVEDARAGGAQLAEIGDRFSLAVETPAAFDASGNGMDGTPAGLPDAEGLVAGTFESDIGVENDVLQLGDQGFLWYEVAEVTPSRDRTLDEVKDDVVAAWKRQELAQRLDDSAADMLSKVENGTPFIALAAETGLAVMPAQGLTRSAPSGDLGRDALTAVFSGPVGTAATTASADGSGRVVLKVTGISVPEFDSSAPQVVALGSQVSQQIQDTLLGQFISDQETKAGVEINNVGVTRILGLDNH